MSEFWKKQDEAWRKQVPAHAMQSPAQAAAELAQALEGLARERANDSERMTTMSKAHNWEGDDAYRARLIAERARLELPQQARVEGFLAKATGFDLDLWGRDLATPRLGVSAGHAAAVLAWDANADVRPEPEPAADLAQALEGPAAIGSVSVGVRTPDGHRPMTEAEARALPQGAVRVCTVGEVHVGSIDDASALLAALKLPDPLTPWRALAAAVVLPAAVELYTRNWGYLTRGEDTVSWDSIVGEHGGEAVLFTLRWRGQEEAMTYAPYDDAIQLLFWQRDLWHAMLGAEWARGGLR